MAFLGGVLAHRGLVPPGQAVLAVALGAAIVDNLFSGPGGGPGGAVRAR
ncbi:MAG: hypothetical protein R3D85_12255 [Paracoccaceae bacterium]